MGCRVVHRARGAGVVSSRLGGVGGTPVHSSRLEWAADRPVRTVRRELEVRFCLLILRSGRGWALGTPEPRLLPGEGGRQPTGWGGVTAEPRPARAWSCAAVPAKGLSSGIAPPVHSDLEGLGMLARVTPGTQDLC